MVTSHSFYRFPANMSQSQLIRKQWTMFKIWCDKARSESQTTFVKMVDDARRDKDKLCKAEPKRKDYHESVFDGQKTRLREQIQEGFVALLREEWQLRLRRIGLDEDDMDSDQRGEYEEFFNGDPSTIIKPHSGNAPISDPVSSGPSPYDSDITLYETSPIMNTIDLEKPTSKIENALPSRNNDPDHVLKIIDDIHRLHREAELGELELLRQEEAHELERFKVKRKKIREWFSESEEGVVNAMQDLLGDPSCLEDGMHSLHAGMEDLWWQKERERKEETEELKRVRREALDRRRDQEKKMGQRREELFEAMYASVRATLPGQSPKVKRPVRNSAKPQPSPVGDSASRKPDPEPVQPKTPPAARRSLTTAKRVENEGESRVGTSSNSTSSHSRTRSTPDALASDNVGQKKPGVLRRQSTSVPFGGRRKVEETRPAQAIPHSAAPAADIFSHQPESSGYPAFSANAPSSFKGRGTDRPGREYSVDWFGDDPQQSQGYDWSFGLVDTDNLRDDGAKHVRWTPSVMPDDSSGNATPTVGNLAGTGRSKVERFVMSMWDD